MEFRKQLNIGDKMVATRDLHTGRGELYLVKGHVYKVINSDKKDFTIIDELNCTTIFMYDHLDENYEFYCLASLKEIRKNKINSLL